MKNDSIARGTAIIALANVATRIIGLLFRIVLVSLAGSGAIGLFQMIFPIYFVVLVLATGGIPTVVAKLVAQYSALRQSSTAAMVVRKALIVCFLSGTVACAVLLSASSRLAATVLADPRTELAMRIIAIALPLVSITSVLRGYLQGIRKMGVIALAQLVEQLVRVPVSLYLVAQTFPYGAVYVAAALAAGIVCGEITACLTLLVACRRSSSLTINRGLKKSVSYFKVIVPALPITLARLLLSLGQAINATLIPHCLVAAGYTVPQATVAFAELTGMAFTLFFAPVMLIGALVINLVPSVSSFQASGLHKLQHLCANAYRLVIVLGIPLGAIFVFGGSNICGVLFRSKRAGTLLAMLGPSAVFVYSLQVSSSILQGLGLMKMASLGTILNSVISITGIWFLTPQQGITGTAAAFAVSFVLSGLTLLVIVNGRIKVIRLLLPTIKRALAGGAAAALIWLLIPVNNLPSLLAAAALSLLVYLASLWLLGERLQSITV